MNKHLFAGVVVMVTSIVLAIIMMAVNGQTTAHSLRQMLQQLTGSAAQSDSGHRLMCVLLSAAVVGVGVVHLLCVAGWAGNCDVSGNPPAGDSACYHVGLRTMTVDPPKGSTGGSSRTLDLQSDCVALFGGNSVLCDQWYAGGTTILATGIVAFVVFIVALVCMTFAHRRMLANYRYGALLGLYVTSGLMVLGIVLYAYKQRAGFSFILMTVAGFCYFIGVGLVLGGGWEISLAKGAQKPKDTPDS